MKLHHAARTHILELMSRVRWSTLARLEADDRSRAKQLTAARAEGAAMSRMRISEFENPYLGTNNELRRAWRDGWLSEWRKR